MARRDPTIVLHVGAVPAASRLMQQCLTPDSSVWPANIHTLPDATLRRDIGSGQTLVANPEGFAGTLRETFDAPGIDVIIGTHPMLGPAFGGPPGTGLHAEADAALQALAEVTAPYRRVIVLSVCPQAQLIEMGFEEVVRRGRDVHLGAWLASLDLDNLSWLPLLDRLTAAFGRPDVIVHDFDRTVPGRVDFLRAALGAADLRLPEAVAEKTAPPSLRLSETGVRLALAADAHLATDRQRAELRSFLLRRFSELEGPPGSVLTHDQRSRLQQRYDSELSTLGVGQRRASGR
jgi:hypothetical protein